MKKLISGLVCLGLLLGMAACTGGDSKSKVTSQTNEQKSGSSLRIAWWGSQARNDGTVAVTKLYKEKNPSVTFEPEFSDWGGYWSKLATQVAGNAIPDIIQMDFTQLNTYVSKKQLADLTPYIKSGLLDVSKIPEQSLKTGKVGDGLYALVLGVNVPCMFYDKDVVQQAGLTMKDNLTYDEFFKMSKTIYQKTGVKTDMDYGKEETYLAMYLREKGYHLYSEDGKKLGVPNAGVLTDFFKIYVDGMKEGYMVPPEVFTELDVNAVEQNTLVAKKSWCTFLFSNQMSAIVAASGRNIGIASVPADNPKQLQYIKPSQFFSISANSANPEEAVKFINWFVNSNEANEILLGERGIPSNKQVADYIAPKMSKTDQTVIEFINKVNGNCSEIDPPVPAGSGEIASLVSEIQEKVCYKNITPEEGGAQLFERANKILAAKAA